MRLIKIIIILLVFTSCKKEKVVEPENVLSLKNGLLILNEGLFQLNNSSLSWVNLNSNEVNNSFFEQKAGRALGDTGNDIKRYGNKIYIVVNVSSTVEVLDAISGNSIKQIQFLNGNQSKQVRSIAFFGSKAFVTCFDGYVDVFDTSNFVIEKRIKVGLNPDQISASNSKIFVSNSGGLNSPVYDSTLSVINPQSLLEENKIVVGKNPGYLEIINNGLFVHQRGNYSSVPSVLKRINLTTLQTDFVYGFNPLQIEKMGSNLLLAYEENQVLKIGIFDPLNNAWINPDFINTSGIETLYNIHYETKNNRIYLFDAHGYTVSGEVLEYTSNGNLIQKFKVGLNPSGMLYFD